MGKRFGLRISRVLPSFHSCRSAANTAIAAPSTSSGTTTPLAFPSTPATSPPQAPPQPPTTRLRHVPVVPPPTSLCRCRPPRPSSRTPTSSTTPTLSPSLTPCPAGGFSWDADEKWHVVARVASGAEAPRRRKVDPAEADALFPPLSLPRPSYRKSVGKRSKRKRRKHRQHPAAARPSSSSAETRWFTTDDDGEREADECEDDSETLLASTTDDGELTGRVSLSGFLRRLSCVGGGGSVEGAAGNVLRGSTAVVKRSDDPYTDFRQSMAEMVVENGMYSASELEGLLRCFLSLNSHRHHSAIVRAFSDIWDAVFSSPASTVGLNSASNSSPLGPRPALVNAA